MKKHKEPHEFTVAELELVESWLLVEMHNLELTHQSVPKALHKQLSDVRLWIKEEKAELEYIKSGERNTR